MEYFRDFWSKEKHGKHLYRDEDFFLREAKEQLYHLEGGDSLIDFGCGAAESLVYCAEAYKTVVGVDFSLSMLAEAQRRLEKAGISNVKLIHADNKTVWKMLDDCSYDRIMSYGVVQYLTHSELDNFIHQASIKLSDKGKIILFTILDPTRWYLRRMSLLNEEAQFSIINVIREIAILFVKRMRARLRHVPPDDIGYAYSPKTVKQIASKYNLKMEYVWSLYYVDRYHAILTPELQ